MPITSLRPPGESTPAVAVQTFPPSFTSTGLQTNLPLFCDGDWFDDHDGDQVVSPELIAPDVAEEVERLECGRLVRAAVRELPPQQRMVIALLFWHDLQQREIGVLIGVSEGRVSQIIKSAEKSLRAKLVHLND